MKKIEKSLGRWRRQCRATGQARGPEFAPRIHGNSHELVTLQRQWQQVPWAPWPARYAPGHSERLSPKSRWVTLFDDPQGWPLASTHVYQNTHPPQHTSIPTKMQRNLIIIKITGKEKGSKRSGHLAGSLRKCSWLRRWQRDERIRQYPERSVLASSPIPYLSSSWASCESGRLHLWLVEPDWRPSCAELFGTMFQNGNR